jgi:hypothetical protein
VCCAGGALRVVVREEPDEAACDGEDGTGEDEELPEETRVGASQVRASSRGLAASSSCVSHPCSILSPLRCP